MDKALAWKPGDATKLAAFHRQYAPVEEVEAPLAFDAPVQPELSAWDIDTAALLNDVAAYMHADTLAKRAAEAEAARVVCGNIAYWTTGGYVTVEG